jgi:hypothetical protein
MAIQLRVPTEEVPLAIPAASSSTRQYPTCDLCSREYATKEFLARHLRDHLGEKLTRP